MLPVVQGLLEVMPQDMINLRTAGGTPSGWSALSLLCNSRDAANERERLIRAVAVEAGADLNIRTASHGTTPLMTCCACGFWSGVRILLDARAGPHLKNNGGKTALDVTPSDQSKARFNAYVQ